MPTDEELLRAFYGGDTSALEHLIERYERYLAGLLLYCVGDVQVARRLFEELVAEVYLTRQHPENHFDPSRGPVRGFLLGQAGSLAFLWLRGLLSLD